MEELKRDIVETTREKTSFVRETSIKEGRLFSLIEALRMLRTSEGFMTLLETEGLAVIGALFFGGGTFQLLALYCLKKRA